MAVAATVAVAVSVAGHSRHASRRKSAGCLRLAGQGRRLPTSRWHLTHGPAQLPTAAIAAEPPRSRSQLATPGNIDEATTPETAPDKAHNRRPFHARSAGPTVRACRANPCADE